VKLEASMDRTEQLYFATRSEIVMSIAAALLFAGVMAWRFAPELGGKVLLGIAAAGAWVAISLYWFRARIWRREPPPADALAVTGAEHYRRELECRRDHLKNEWIWHGPLFLACVTLVATLAGKTSLPFMGVRRILPLLVLLVVWTVFTIVRRRRAVAELQREIDEL
jgi:hypothetical protein